MKKALLYTLLFLGLLPLGFSQQHSATAPNGAIRCHSVEYNQQLRQQYPDLPSIAEFEQWMAQKVALQNQGGHSTLSGPVRTIPVVFHIIYSNATENLSAAQINSQLDVLNEDFRRTNPDTTNTPAAFQGVAVDTEIEFCMATQDPLGNTMSEPGINRVSLAGSPFSTNYVDNTIKPTTGWDPTKYFNIWVCNISGGILGWAQFPSNSGLGGLNANGGAANTDGVVLLHSSVGRPPFNPFPGPYNLGRTATHEVGHWLGLRHIWGDGGCAVDDFCADTPESDGSNFGCNPAHISCSTTDMVQNYMDYTDDDCMNIFTADQKARMDVVLANSPRRLELLTSNVCSVSPEIYFTTSSSTLIESGATAGAVCRRYKEITARLTIGGPPTGDAICTINVIAGTATNGIDYQLMTPSVTFTSGIKSDQNITIRIYDDAMIEGTEDFTLGYTLSGTTDAFSGASNQTHQVNITDDDALPTPSGTTVLLNEDFESGAGGWVLDHTGGQNRWRIAQGINPIAGNASTRIARANGNANYRTNSTSSSRLVSPQLNATGLTNLDLSFDFLCNGERFNGVNYDYGKLEYSLDGTNWVNIEGDATNSPFVNQATVTTYSTTLPAACENTTFYLGWAWENDNNSGTNPGWYIDNITVSSTSTTLIENTLGGLDQQYLGPNSTVYFYDQVSGELMAKIDNTSAHDYGCTSIQVDRAGTNASLYQSSNVAFSVTDKTFLITPANNNPFGTYTIRLYYRGNEVNGWEAATGQLRTNMNVAKTNGPVSNITPGTPFANGPVNWYGSTPTIGTFGTDFWVEADFSSGFSGFGGGVVSTALSIRYEDFSATRIGSEVRLDWTYNSTEPVDHFEIERSLDGLSFEKIGEAEGINGQDSHLHWDMEASEQGREELWYRLRGIEMNGLHTLSEVRKVTFSDAFEMKLFPNPFSDELTLWLNLPIAEPLQVRVYDVAGKSLADWSKDALAGGQEYSFSFFEGKAAGIYFVEVRVGNDTFRRKVVKR